LRITADTNILVRAAVADDPEQTRAAADLLRGAEAVVITVPALCEFVWVSRRGYRRSATDIAISIRELAKAANAIVDSVVVEAGLTMLEAGGDFADGVIAFEGRRLGGEVFASFDRQAIQLIAEAGGETLLVGSPQS
jgi:predicted nucleic-acid-binding protein